MDGLELSVRDRKLRQYREHTVLFFTGAYLRILADISSMQPCTWAGGAGTKVASSIRSVDPIQTWVSR